MSESETQADNEFWERLLNPTTLRRGWDLARADSKRAFIEELYVIDAFAINLLNNLKEISNKIKAEAYRPKPLIQIEVPKNTLSVRPGSSVSLEDKIVLNAIVCLIVEPIDDKIIKGVYSYRLDRKNKKRKDSLFRKSGVFDIPYLKKRTISQKIDPFESWYVNWPAFDKESKKAFTERGHKFMAVSDISAYFENIQIPILRDQLLKTLANEPKIVNLLASFLESWGVRTHDGRPQWRGIPQGDEASSFLGNSFLIPLDNEFQKFCKTYGAEYFRYVDDVRIFTKKENQSRRAILLLNRTLKALHLNVQSAKTKILKEDDNEMSQNLMDERLDKINDIIDEISKKNLQNVQRKNYIKQINQLAQEQPNKNSQKIIFAKRKPLIDGLDSRFFRRWVYAHLILKSTYFTERLIFEIINNPDPRITKWAISTTKTFPRLKVFSAKLLDFIKSDLNIFPHQEAEIIRSFRYLSNIPENILDHCKHRAFDPEVNFYVRMQSFYLLSRVDLSEDEYEQICQSFEAEPNQDVQIAMAGNMIKYEKKNSKILETLVFHPDDKVRKIGAYFRAIKWDKKIATGKLNYLFSKNYDISMRLCDDMPILYLLTYNKEKNFIEIRKKLRKCIKLEKDKVIHMDHRNILNNIYTELSRAEEKPNKF